MSLNGSKFVKTEKQFDKVLNSRKKVTVGRKINKN